MARKKKYPKHSNSNTTLTNDHSNANTALTATPTTTVTTTKQLSLAESLADSSPLERVASFEKLVVQQQQQQQELAQEQTHNQTQQYQSDGELIELKQKLNLEKNKSNLFLIKSYSFNDKTNAKRPQTLNLNTKFDKFHPITLDESSGSTTTMEFETKQNHKEQLEKPIKKLTKLKKIKKSKSTYDSTENLQEFQNLLRKPKQTLSLEEHKQGTGTNCVKRPLSMPVTQTQHRNITKSKTLDDLETPRLKRDSFIRHSLQSIRRSFTSHKKHQPQNNNTCPNSNSSASNASSNSSAVSDNLKKLNKTKDYAKDIGNLKDVEESNYLIAEEQHQTMANGNAHTSCCNIVIALNDVQTINEQQQQQLLETEQQRLECVSGSGTLKTMPALSTNTYYALDSLAVLQEEDEKDLCLGSSNIQPPCTNTQQRSTSSVSTLAQLPTSPMAPLQTHTECQSVQCLNILDKDYKSLSSTNTKTGTTASSSSPPQKVKKTFQHQLSIPESLQTTSIGCATSTENSSSRSFKHSGASLTPLPTLHSSGSSRSISPLRHSASGNSSSTAKHEQSNTAAATAVAAATATTSNGSSSTTTTPPEKEKKRKEISSSRVKKFHRHFSQVSKDEKLINYFSCALVSDILLQGHLYITDQHFAFYSNVFGYVTKVVIPTSSVTKISKEKTAKIIPNAVGVATADERHVFGSFISREAAFRLMCSVCPPLGLPEILPKDPTNIEISEECSIEDDSSCSISGNESPAQITELLSSKINGNLLHNDTSQTLLRRSVASSNLSLAEKANDKIRHSDVPASANTATNAASLRSSAPPTATTNAHYANGSGGVKLIGLKSVLQPATHEIEGKLTLIAGCASTTTSASSTPTPSSSSAPTTVMTLPMSKANHALNILRSVSKNLMSHIKFPTEIHVVYLGVVLTLLLALFSIFLLYRILDIEAKANGYRSPVEFDWRSGNDDEIFREALRFQKQLQLKSTEEAQSILKTNLEQIAKVRRSLETLSMLIHDRSSSFISTNTDDSD